MRATRLFRLCLTLALTAAVLGWQRSSPPGGSTGLLNDGAVAVRIQFGVIDKTPRPWNGSLTVADGELLSLRDSNPRAGDKIEKSSWTLATTEGKNFIRRPWEEESVTEPVPYRLIPGIIVDVKGGAATRVNVQTKNGNFELKPFELRAGSAVRMLNGAVLVERAPSAQAISAADSQGDFASVLTGKNGEVWTAWVSYTAKQNEVLARRFDGQAWSPIVKVTERPGDVYMARLGHSRDGIWVVWSGQVDGNWDLYGRRFDGKAWGATERLTSEPQPDVHPSLATDAKGNLWVAWQGFRNGKSDIFARRYDGSRWSDAEQISASAANDWEPAITADHEGRVYIAWDTYDKGNYDVVMRRFEGGTWSQVMPVAATPKFEAHVSLACDRQNRLWAAWNESGFQWGKDTGFLVKKEATRLYQSRWVGVAVYAGNEWQEPAADFNQGLPRDLAEYNDYPSLAADASGRVWLFFRHRTAKFRDVHNNAPAHRAAWEILGSAYEGNRWALPVEFPFSQGRTDVQAGFAADERGNMYAAWATDNRDFDEYLFNRSEVYAGRLMLPPARAGAPKLQPRHVPKLVYRFTKQ